MKKMFMLFLMFLFFDSVYALDIETQITEAKNNIISLENKVTKYENERLDKTYPVGTVYKTIIYSTKEQVASSIGGTWEVYGSGKTLIGINTSDSTFNAPGKTGGNASTTLTTSTLPSHTHSIPALSGTAASNGAHTHTVYIYYGQSGYGSTIPASTHYLRCPGTLEYTSTSTVADKNHFWSSILAKSAGAHSHNVTTTANTSGSAGSGTSFTNLQPYITVYMYKRVA